MSGADSGGSGREREREAGGGLSVTNLIAVGSLAVALVSAFVANEARNEAQQLAEQKFQSETTLRILETAFAKLAAAPDDGSSAQQQQMACYFVVHLAEAEQQYRSEAPFLVRDFFDSLVAAGLVAPSCLMRSEGLSRDAPRATAIAAPPDRGRPTEIGKWHALIASYDTSERGCAFAREDVEQFGRLLRGQGLAGLFVYVARTRISNNYAVTVDAGDDRELAQRASRIIRSRSRSTADQRTGADSFVQGNRDWFIDDGCTAFARLQD